MTDFNYFYNLRLRFANPNQKGSFKEHQEYFRHCVCEYNNAAQNARNKKKIEIVNINENHIDILLYSNADLTKAPGRALMHLTALLIKEEIAGFDNYFKNHLYHNKLFYTEQISVTKNFETVSDAEFVKRLIDYISKPKSEISVKDKSTMNRIKLIAFENGLI